MAEKMNWKNMGFGYIRTDFRYFSTWEDGHWSEGELKTENTITISEGSTVLHYGQSCFEGLKAFRMENGSVQLFRPDQNALRMQQSCRRLLMPEVSEEQFIDACIRVVTANKDWVPPYRLGALYLRPYVIGIGDNLGLKPAPKYLFGVFCVPVGAYFGNGTKPVTLTVSAYDRAAPNGTGAVKVGGNYAASMLPHHLAVTSGFSDCIYLDPLTHTMLEEVGAANFIGVTNEKTVVTPKSHSILPSITRKSILHLASIYLGLKTEERPVFIDNLSEFLEAGACGTAAVITPIAGIENNGSLFTFHYHNTMGPELQRIYHLLTSIQVGDDPAPEDWLLEVK